MAKTNGSAKAVNGKSIVDEKEIIQNAVNTVAPYLADLKKVQKTLKRNERTELVKGIALGTMLCEVQPTFPRGKFYDWAVEYTEYGKSTLELFMQLSRNSDKISECASIREARKVMKGKTEETEGEEKESTERKAKTPEELKGQIAKILRRVEEEYGIEEAANVLSDIMADFNNHYDHPEAISNVA